MTVEEIFLTAVEKAPAERAAYLDAACGGDADLRGQAEALLRSHEQAGSLLEQPLFRTGSVGDGTRTSPSTADGDLPLDFLHPSDKPGSIGRLGHYEVQEVIGRGGMGVVLRAFDEQLHRVVAIKVMAPQLATSVTARRRFTREARAAAAVTHDHVVTIHAVDDSGPLPYIVMQFVSGASLQERLDRTGPLQLHEILRIGMQTASGLAAAHAQGLVHRDVKPANILLENGVERVKLTDFGLARAADDASLTQSGAVAGTPQYMSPEQAEGKPVDARSDLFSLGSVLYAMGTGRPPFRAGTSMGVLKRVCEDTPTPVREANPEVPDWLSAVIGKLHAKDPADRFPAAAEVGEVLGRHLAQVQHPSQAPLPAVVRPATGPPAPVRRSRGRGWATAAAVLVAVLATLGTTEATGATNVRATVIRIFTPEGTLVVETDDPAVTVTVEGDGDLVITGAGPQEVRLRAGSYRLKATKDGQPVKLDRDLVNITRGDKQIVRVRMEGDTATVAAPKAESGAFVLLSAGKERKFDTLVEAVTSSLEGNTIEIRGNGPFVSDGVSIPHHLVIRAGAGFAPSITLSKASADKNIPLIFAPDVVVLEGLELRRMYGATENVGDYVPLVLYASPRGSFRIANCRLIFKGVSHKLTQGALFGSQAKSLSVRNSELIGNIGQESGFSCASGCRYEIENCVCALGGIGFYPQDSSIKDVAIGVRKNTFVGNCLSLILFNKPDIPIVDAIKPSIQIAFSENVVRTDETSRNKTLLVFHQAHGKAPFTAAQAEAMLPRLITLHENHNVYKTGGRMLDVWANWNTLDGKRGRNLTDWNRLWNQTDTGSVEGTIHFHGGDLMARARHAPEQLTAADFRLRSDSAGYGAGPGGKDLGADVDLVGPGAAYERWKKTPEYQQWLKETMQLKK